MDGEMAAKQAVFEKEGAVVEEDWIVTDEEQVGMKEMQRRTARCLPGPQPSMPSLEDVACGGLCLSLVRSVRPTAIRNLGCSSTVLAVSNSHVSASVRHPTSWSIRLNLHWPGRPAA